ncbi:secreted protein, partial [Candidatus Omnitrophus magneticus]
MNAKILIKKVFSIVTLVIFSWTNTPANGEVFKNSVMDVSTNNSFIKTNTIEEKVYKDIARDLREGVPIVPEYMGNISESFIGAGERVIVNIEDAHCNYYAVKRIKDLVEYLSEKYGLGLVCLEGGVGSYDLSGIEE